MLLVLWMIFGRNDVGFVYWMGGVIVSMGYLGFFSLALFCFWKKDDPKSTL